MAWKPKRNGRWREFLTADEWRTVKQHDKIIMLITRIREKNIALLAQYDLIQNRATQRARAAERSSK